MLPDRLSFLSEFNNFYNSLVTDIKENRYNERDFYLIIIAKAKSMDQERREKISRKRTIKVIGAKKIDPKS